MSWFTSGMGRYLDLTIFFSITLVFFGLAATPSISAPTPDWERDKIVKKANKACKAPVTEEFLYRLRVMSLYSLTLDMDRDSFYKNSASLRQEIQDDPSNLSNYLELANRLSFLSLKESSAYDGAMKLYQFVISNDVTGKLTPSVNLGIGGLLDIHQKYDQALSQYDQILQNPKLDAEQIAKAHAGRGLVLEQLCQEDAALSAYASAIYAHLDFFYLLSSWCCYSCPVRLLITACSGVGRVHPHTIYRRGIVFRAMKYTTTSKWEGIRD